MAKYNLVILTPDQYRADYISSYGHPTIGTKNIDRLASDGVRFDNCYCAAPLCGPSRISFATSMRFSEHNRRNYWSTIDYSVPNLVSTLKSNGYRTSMFGKNHLFLYDQLEQAWDEVHEKCLDNYDDHPKFKKSYSSFPLEKDHPYNITSLLADEAVDLIERSSKDEPFFCWVNWQDPHPAFTCPEPYASMFDPADVKLPANWARKTDDKPVRLDNWRANSCADQCSEIDAKKAIAMYMGQCRYVDDQVGKIMDSLEKTGQLENTIVFFMSDHGEFLGDFGVFHKLPMFYQCLTKVPAIIRYPKSMDVKPLTFNGLVELVDIAPTLLQALDTKVPQSMVGESMHQNILDGDDSGRESVLVEAGLQIHTHQTPVEGANHRAPEVPNSFGPGAMVFDGRYKLCMYSDDVHELYDLNADPHEMRNLYGIDEYTAIQAKMMEMLVRRQLSVGVRPDGEWTGPGIDVRRNPPEARQTQWQEEELYKRTPQRIIATRTLTKQKQINQRVIEIAKKELDSAKPVRHAEVILPTEPKE